MTGVTALELGDGAAARWVAHLDVSNRMYQRHHEATTALEPLSPHEQAALGRREVVRVGVGVEPVTWRLRQRLRGQQLHCLGSAGAKPSHTQ